MQFVRKALVLAALMVVAVPSLEAQERRTKEVRLDLVGFETVDGNSEFGFGLPGTVALGIYLNKNIAIEPQVSFSSFSGDGFSANVLQFGAFLPYYFRGDFGQNGLFVAPGLTYSKAGGDLDSDGVVDFGVDVGVKKSIRENLSWRLAGTIRTGDSYEDAAGDSQIAIGARFGIGIFWK